MLHFYPCLGLDQCETKQMTCKKAQIRVQQRISGSLDNVPDVVGMSGGSIFVICATVWKVSLDAMTF